MYPLTTATTGTVEATIAAAITIVAAITK